MIHEYKDINPDWLGVDIPDEEVFNPLDYVFRDNNLEEAQRRLCVLMMNPDYFSFVCKFILNVELLPFQAVILKEFWTKKFPMLIGSRGLSKSYTIAIYVILRCLLIPKRKVVVVGAAFRQSKVIFNYVEEIINNAPVLRSMMDSNSGFTKGTDMYMVTINKSTAKFLPLGDGEKIRGQRAHDVICDETATVPIDIFERVVAGFGNVAQNPVQKVKDNQRKKLNISKKKIDPYEVGNQIIMSGTAYYSFNHFCKYWQRYKQWLETKGDKRKIQELTKDQKASNAIGWDDYSIMRIPVDLLPQGLMDEGMITRLRSTVSESIALMELFSCFSNDSDGFFKRKLIESCVVREINPIILNPEEGPIFFQASTKGRSGATHVFGVDPAASKDNFSIVVLEVNQTHRRIVYCWTTNLSRHKEALQKNVTGEVDYYRYCTRKIRDLMQKFSCSEIAIDTQGGGRAIIEALKDPNHLKINEVPIYPVIDPDKEKDTDDKPGLHIIRECNNADANWLGEANHGMRKDFEDKILLFPYFDTVTLELSYFEDTQNNTLYDTLEDCVLNIEELKDELSSIVITQTPAGREKWDTPETKTDVGKKISQHKDRYSALMMANMSARREIKINPFDNYKEVGGVAQSMTYDDLTKVHGDYYTVGPDWWVSQMKGFEY